MRQLCPTTLGTFTSAGRSSADDDVHLAGALGVGVVVVVAVEHQYAVGVGFDLARFAEV